MTSPSEGDNYTLIIEYLPPGPNRLNGAKWQVIQNESRKAARAVWLAWNNGNKPRANGRKAKLDITIHCRGRGDDVDNRFARLKRIIDALVRLDVLVDDNETYLELSIPKHEPYNGKGYVEVAIHYGETIN
jgi:hypothetical protein